MNSKQNENIILDDYIIDDDNFTWTQLCPKCHDDAKYLEGVITDSATDELICGVRGCDNTAQYYWDVHRETSIIDGSLWIKQANA
jgi:hypothetical protein